MSTDGSSSLDEDPLQEVGNPEFDGEITETASSSSSMSLISVNERGMPVFTIPQTLATVIPPSLPTSSSETTSSAAQTTHWHTTFFITTYPTATDTQSTTTQSTTGKSPTTSSQSTASSITTSETPNKDIRTDKAPKAVIGAIVILGLIVCSLLVATCWFRKKRKRFYRERKNNLPGGDRPQTRGGFGLPVPMRELRSAGDNKTPTSMVRRILPHSILDRNGDTGCPCPQPPNEAKDVPTASSMKKETHSAAAPPGRQRPAPLTLQNERHETARIYQTERQEFVSHDEIASIIDHYAEIPENGGPQYEDLIDEEIGSRSQRYVSPESRTARTETIERPRSEPLFFRLQDSEISGWKGLTPRTPLTPSTGLRTQDGDTPLFPRTAPLSRGNDEREGQNMGNDEEEWGKDSAQYSSETDPGYEARKQEIQRRFGFGEQVFPLRLRNRSSPSINPSSSNVHTMHGWGTFANNDPRWEEHTEHASSRRYSQNASRSQFFFTPHEGGYDHNNISEESVRPRPLVIRKVNSLPLLESLETEPESSSGAAYTNRAWQVPDDRLEYLPATRYDPMEDRTRHDVRSYGSDDTIREIDSTMGIFNSRGRQAEYDIEETSSHYDYGNLDSYGHTHALDMHHYEANDSGSLTDRLLEQLMHTGGPSMEKDPSPSSSRLSQVDLGSVSGSLHMSAATSSTRILQLRRRSQETLISDDLFGPNFRAMRAGRDYVLAVRGHINPPADTGVPGPSGITEDSARSWRRNLKGKMPDRGKP